MGGKFWLFVFFFINLFTLCRMQAYNYSEIDWPELCKNSIRASPIDFPEKSSRNYDNNGGNYISIVTSNYKLLQGRSLNFKDNQRFAVDGTGLGYILIKKKNITYKYDLFEIEINTPSEHTFVGTSADVEIQLKHVKNRNYLLENGVVNDPDAENTSLVISKLYKTDPDVSINPIIQKLNVLSRAPINYIDLNLFINENKSFYHYIGGETEPPCKDNVNLIVFETMDKFTQEQYNDVKNWILPIFPTGNSRVTKPLLGRTIYYTENSGFFITFYLFILFLIII